MEKTELLSAGYRDDTTFEADLELYSSRSKTGSFNHRRLAKLYLLLLHGIILVLIGYIVFQSRWHSAGLNDGIYNPATAVIQYSMTSHRSNGSIMRSDFTGYPDERNNKAWEELIRPLAFNASEQEILASGGRLNDSVRVASGGYLASLGVYHELHCLRRMRLWLYRDIYFPNATDEDEGFMQVHLGHCIEILRLSAMCTPDFGLYTFFWESKEATKPTSRSSSPRKCVNWNMFQDWSRDRMIDFKEPLIQ